MLPFWVAYKNIKIKFFSCGFFIFFNQKKMWKQFNSGTSVAYKNLVIVIFLLKKYKNIITSTFLYEFQLSSLPFLNYIMLVLNKKNMIFAWSLYINKHTQMLSKHIAYHEYILQTFWSILLCWGHRIFKPC